MRGKIATPPLVRFGRLVRRENGCWLWTGHLDPQSYGHFTARPGGPRKWVLAHRWAYEHFVGPIPAGLEIDHLCRVRSCVNPEHLEPVTHTENVRRASRLIVACAQGHAYTAENTYTRPDGTRDCRACIRERARQYKARKRAVA